MRIKNINRRIGRESKKILIGKACISFKCVSFTLKLTLTYINIFYCDIIGDNDDNI